MGRLGRGDRHLRTGSVLGHDVQRPRRNRPHHRGIAGTQPGLRRMRNAQGQDPHSPRCDGARRMGARHMAFRWPSLGRSGTRPGRRTGRVGGQDRGTAAADRPCLAGRCRDRLIAHRGLPIGSGPCLRPPLPVRLAHAGRTSRRSTHPLGFLRPGSPPAGESAQAAEARSGPRRNRRDPCGRRPRRFRWSGSGRRSAVAHGAGRSRTGRWSARIPEDRCQPRECLRRPVGCHRRDQAELQAGTRRLARGRRLPAGTPCRDGNRAHPGKPGAPFADDASRRGHRDGDSPDFPKRGGRIRPIGFDRRYLREGPPGPVRRIHPVAWVLQPPREPVGRSSRRDPRTRQRLYEDPGCPGGPYGVLRGLLRSIWQVRDPGRRATSCRTDEHGLILDQPGAHSGGCRGTTPGDRRGPGPPTGCADRIQRHHRQQRARTPAFGAGRSTSSRWRRCASRRIDDLRAVWRYADSRFGRLGSVSRMVVRHDRAVECRPVTRRSRGSCKLAAVTRCRSGGMD